MKTITSANSPGDDCCLKRRRSTFSVYLAGIGQAEEHADQQLETVRVDIVRTWRPVDFDQDMRFFGFAAVPPIMCDACFDRGGLARLQGQSFPGDASVETATEDGKPFRQVRVEVLAHHCGSRPGGQMSDARSLAAVFGATQDDRIFAGHLVLVDISTA